MSKDLRMDLIASLSRTTKKRLTKQPRVVQDCGIALTATNFPVSRHFIRFTAPPESRTPDKLLANQRGWNDASVWIFFWEVRNDNA